MGSRDRQKQSAFCSNQSCSPESHVALAEVLFVDTHGWLATEIQSLRKHKHTHTITDDIFRYDRCYYCGFAQFT